MPLNEQPAHTGETILSEAFRREELATLGGLSIHIWHPEGLRTNADIAGWGLTTNSGRSLDAKKIKDITGVESRSIASSDDSVQSMASRAVAPFVPDYRSRIRAIEFATSFPEEWGRIPGLNHAQSLAAEHDMSNLFPNLAGLTADGNPTVEANDFVFACSGSAEMLGHNGRYQSSLEGEWNLLVASERYSDKLADPLIGEHDPSHSYAMFGDAAGAMLFRGNEDVRVLGSKTLRFDEGNNAIRMPVEYRFIREPALWLPIALPENQGNPGKFEMDGKAVYQHMAILGKEIGDFIQSLDLEPDNIAAIIPHQASEPVLSGSIKRRLPESLQEKLYIHVKNGNYSSVSIMRALAELINAGRIKLGDIVILAGFGAGLYASLQAIQLGKK